MKITARVLAALLLGSALVHIPLKAGAEDAPEKAAAEAGKLFDKSSSVRGAAGDAPAVSAFSQLSEGKAGLPKVPAITNAFALKSDSPPPPPSSEGPKGKLGSLIGKITGTAAGALAGTGAAVYWVTSTVSSLANGPYNEGAGFLALGVIFIGGPIALLIGLGAGGTGGFMLGGRLGAWIGRKLGHEPNPQTPPFAWTGPLKKIGGILGGLAGGASAFLFSISGLALLSLAGAEGAANTLAPMVILALILGAFQGVKLGGKLGSWLGKKLDSK